MRCLPYAFLSFFCLFISCRHKANIPVSPQISFSQQIQSILVSNCASAGCHDGSKNNHLSPLLTYTDVRALSVPGNAHGSSLYKRITQLSGGVMPPDQPLTEDQIKLIYVWIMQGANNN
jgi:hypothetical protein